MCDADLANVLVIEAACYPQPWSEKTFRECLAASARGYLCCAMELDRVLVGHCIFTVISDEAELLNFCLAPTYQGQKLAREYLEQVKSYASVHGAARMFLEVRQSNIPARRLYVSAGLNEMGLRKNYYPAANGREHAVLMGGELNLI